MELVTGHQATPHITAEQVSRLLQGVTTMDDTTVYRLPIGNNCVVSVSSLDVSIDTGEIVLHGFHTTFEEDYTVTLDPTIDAAKSRIDKIVMEIIEDLTTGIQTANIEVVQGEESSSPVAPATPVAPTSPTEKFLAVGVIATVTVSNITIASSVDNTELYAGSYISEETFSKTVRNQSSDQYNTTKAYKVGDYVIHNDTLYKCITACSAGSWEANQNCFVTDTLTNAVTTLNSDLLRYPNFSNIITSDDVSAGNKTYTATTKCWAYAQATLWIGSNSTDMTISVNNKTISSNNIQTQYGTLSAFFPLDIGDTLKVTTSNTTNGFTGYVIYGVK